MIRRARGYVAPREQTRLAVILGGVLAGGLLLASACGGTDTKPVAPVAKSGPQKHDEAIEHEACNTAGNRVEALDANGDHKPDITRVYDKKTNKELCRISDLNHDGKPDLYESYDASGNIRRREADYDDNGTVDAIEYYEGGKLVRREYDTTGQHRIDTWDYFDPGTGKRIKRERDTNNDGIIDQVWTWDGDKVTIAIDKTGNGHPDPADTIVMGGPDGGTPPPPPPAVAPTVSDAGTGSAPSPLPVVAQATPDAGAADGGGARRKEKR